MAQLQGTDEEYVFVAFVEDYSVEVFIGALVSWASVSSVSLHCVVCSVRRIPSSAVFMTADCS